VALVGDTAGEWMLFKVFFDEGFFEAGVMAEVFYRDKSAFGFVEVLPDCSEQVGTVGVAFTCDVHDIAGVDYDAFGKGHGEKYLEVSSKY
jgi:hypothetical protein